MTTTLQELDEVLQGVEQAALVKDSLIQRDFVSLNFQRALLFVTAHAPEIRAALELQAKLEQGFVLVPREPTPEMCVAGFLSGTPDGFDIETPSDAPGLVYRAMLNAAPPAQGEQDAP